jgi:manganese oxidase
MVSSTRRTPRVRRMRTGLPGARHGNTLTVNGMRTDMMQIMPGMMMVGDMVPDNVGTWLLHCHVNDHILAGMQTRYRVTT